jgi:hypothetical protein
MLKEGRVEGSKVRMMEREVEPESPRIKRPNVIDPWRPRNPSRSEATEVA